MQAELLFAGGSLVLLVAGANLARYGEAIAEKSGVSVTWVGLFLVAAVTSLPELFTGVSSVLVVGDPDLAAGDALGSCVFNLAIAAAAGLATLRVATRPEDHAFYRLGAVYSTGMLLVVAAGLAAAPLAAPPVLGLASASLVVIYFVAIRHLFGAQAQAHREPSARFAALSRRRVALTYLANSVVVVAVAASLPFLAGSIAEARGLSSTFAGTALLALSTSLPEVVVTIAAIRSRAVSLAIGGLLGSNLFDLAILAIDDLAYAKGPILAAMDPAHLVTIAGAGALTWLLVLALPAGRRPRPAALVGMLAVYAGTLVLAAANLPMG